MVCWRLDALRVAWSRSPELRRTSDDGKLSTPFSSRKPQWLTTTPSGMTSLPLVKTWRSILRMTPMSGPSAGCRPALWASNSAWLLTKPGVAGFAIVEKTHWNSGTVWVNAIVFLLPLPEDAGDLRLRPSCLLARGHVRAGRGDALRLGHQPPVGEHPHRVQPTGRRLRHLGVAVHGVGLLDEALVGVERRPGVQAGVDRQQDADARERVALDDVPLAHEPRRRRRRVAFDEEHVVAVPVRGVRRDAGVDDADERADLVR